MVDITFKEIPEGAIEEAKQMVLVAVRRFLERTELQIDEAKVNSFNSKLSTFVNSNDLASKKISPPVVIPEDI